MFWTIPHRTRLAPALQSFTRSAHCATATEHQNFWKPCDSISRRPLVRISQKSLSTIPLKPQIYHAESLRWNSFQDGSRQEALPRGSILKVVSWNIDSFNPSPGTRASTALHHLQGLFGTEPSHLVVMLQEVCWESLQVIMENEWVRQNYMLTNVDPPQLLHGGIPEDLWGVKDRYWRAARYFTIMMIPRHIGIVNCFRMPLKTVMGRDALFVDIQIPSSGLLRLCTTHLESRRTGKPCRRGQLASISEMLQGPQAMKAGVIAGLVGGDMNAIHASEHSIHQDANINLNDAWEDVPPPPLPILKPFQRDLSYGRARGHTYGYHPNGSRIRSRKDKYYYAGTVEIVPLTESHDIAGKLGRIGVGLTAEVEAFEDIMTRWKTIRGKMVKREYKFYYSHDQAQGIKAADPDYYRTLRLTKIKTCVSDHFGIAVGVKVP
ncbi:hypothetical protein BKA66DRAFT_443907 [Pyrenochaeta sp. MPI-SDFR-AT-0127]|nr:hypothetical protein BKA66DRAFT_443907 [Pyrenochaeta sp. MPI-SDFR-AT-0127]